MTKEEKRIKEVLSASLMIIEKGNIKELKQLQQRINDRLCYLNKVEQLSKIKYAS
jgi:hypothetical protein